MTVIDERALEALVPVRPVRRVANPIDLPVQVEATRSGNVRMRVGVVLGDVLGELATEYANDPERVGQLLTDLALARAAVDDASREVPPALLDEALSRAADNVGAALGRLMLATVAGDPEVRLTPLQALYVADRLEDATRQYGGWNGGAA